ncbi:MAG: AAA family ATPase [Armatimonadetes bacterium]|nr:AAA family ATPase [Armatimonadota bacterium]
MAVRRRPIENFTVTQAANVLGISPETLRRMDRRGDAAPSIREGKRRIYTAEDLGRLREMLSGRKRKATTAIALVNQKGGVGKTTITINLAGALATQGYRVLIVDFDPQANCSFGLGVLWNDLEASVADVLGYEVSGPTRQIAQIIRPAAQHPNLFLAPSHLNLAAAEMVVQNTMGREMKLDKALDEVRADYDFILVDSPPSLGLLSINAMVASDAVLIPIDGAFSLEGVRQLLNTRKGCAELSRHPIHVLGGVLNRQRAGTANAAAIMEMATAIFGKRMFQTVIPERTAVDGSTAARAPIVFSGLPEAEPYHALAEEVISSVVEITGN